MIETSNLGKTLLFCGAILIIVGLLFIFAGKIPGFGRLPGDIFIKKENFSFYFPIATCILLSVIISFILFFMGHRR
ncbi:MAG: DUF2905 domain-containing protein [Candidatus Omnitrophota bacterium]|jgi:hypothetical protein|nr:DUF2905 domain-containing protein [Candidatus Omnitrophota bacterium]